MSAVCVKIEYFIQPQGDNRRLGKNLCMISTYCILTMFIQESFLLGEYSVDTS
jgi:hypothetical protein